MAQLDRLGSAKEVAQIAAVIGREFSHALLSAVVGKRQPELASALDRLMASRLLFRQGVPPHASYLFKHRWCKTLPTARCWANPAGHFTLALPKFLKASSLTLPRTSRSFWRVITARPG